MNSARLNTLLLALAATATLLPTAARADRWDDRDDRDDWHHRHNRVIVVERDRPAPAIPYAAKSDRRGFVISPYTGATLDVAA